MYKKIRVAARPIKSDNIELVDRGYEKLEERLRSMGAKIQRTS